MVEFKNKDVAGKYEMADAEQKDTHIHVPKQYAGPLSGITLEAADQYVEKEGGKMLRLKQVAGSSSLSVVKSSTQSETK